MGEREILTNKISAYQFAINDMQLFLDTHPHDSKTLEKINEYRKVLEPLIAEYEEKYGPLTKSSTEVNHWNWIKNPWPCEIKEDN